MHAERGRVGGVEKTHKLSNSLALTDLFILVLFMSSSLPFLFYSFSLFFLFDLTDNSFYVFTKKINFLELKWMAKPWCKHCLEFKRLVWFKKKWTGIKSTVMVKQRSSNVYVTMTWTAVRYVKALKLITINHGLYLNPCKSCVYIILDIKRIMAI